MNSQGYNEHKYHHSYFSVQFDFKTGTAKQLYPPIPHRPDIQAPNAWITQYEPINRPVPFPEQSKHLPIVVHL